MATVAEALRRSVELANVSDTPRLDTEVLLCHVLGKDRTFLFTWPEYSLSAEQMQQFEKALGRRKAGEPVAHITGMREFWSLALHVDSTTLIPRPETELLVQIALELPLPEKACVLDLGTGSGAIALALASERPQWSVTAVDKVVAAVALAQKNCKRLLLNNVVIKRSDWFSEFDTSESFDLIVSNPPYVESQDLHLQRGDVRFEPRSALVAGKNGMAEIEIIAAAAPKFLNERGWLMVEHGFNQGDAVRTELKKNEFAEVVTRQDLAGVDRVTLGGKIRSVNCECVRGGCQG